MTNVRKQLTAIVLTLGVLMPGITAAAVNTTIDLKANTGGNTSGTSGNAKIDVSIKNSGGSSVVTTTLNGSSTTYVDDSPTVDISHDVSGDTDVSITVAPIRVERSSIKADTKAVAATDVRSSADLQGYVVTEMKSDENLSRVDASADDVKVTYRQSAKLFGFIPMRIKVTADVNKDGKVVVRYPWYSFLLVTNKTELETKLMHEIGGRVGSVSDASGSLSAHSQAQIVSTVKSVMHSELQASAQTTAAATVQ